MSVINQYKPEVNYWEVDPQLVAIEPFKTLYEKDKTKNKRGSSQKMWAVAFFSDPESRFYNYSEEEKLDVIKSDIIGKDKKFSWDELKDHIRGYMKLYMTQAERTLYTWNRKLEERDKYLNNVPYSELSLDEAKKLDTLISNTPDLYSQYEKILETIREEEVEGKTKGNRKESLTEKKII